MARSTKTGVESPKAPKRPDPVETGEVAKAADPALEQRIERLEKRLEETIGEAAHHIRSDHEPAAKGKPDALHRAIDRANKKRS